MSGEQHYYITTAIDYANGPPHLGHALEKIGADAIARYHRLKGESVHFVIGMDEHGLKVLQSAQAADVSPQAWVDDIAARFETAWQRVGISHDDFIRTTQARHRRAVGTMIERMQANGDLYRGTYEGWYCVGCEAYKTEAELERADSGMESPRERADTESGGGPANGGAAAWRCPLHPARELSWMREQNWFFRLSRYQDRLGRLLDERPEFIQPEARRNEIRRVVEAGLEDISVSRARLPWGVPWPGDAEHTVYVWIDALTNYLSAVDFPEDGHRRFWPADLHVIGKDITRFHTIYWPAMLMSADVPLPRVVWAHGFATLEGRKISKSEGVWVDLDEAIDRHGPDAFRYYLLREMPWDGDGDFSWKRFDERYVAELADDLGNLASRVLSMIEKYRDGVVPEGEPTELDRRIADAVIRYRGAMDAHLLHIGAAAAVELARDANGFVVERAPWKQAKDPAQAAALDATLASLARAVAALATLLFPFMPTKMTALARQMGLGEVLPLEALATFRPAGQSVRRGEVLFPKERAPA